MSGMENIKAGDLVAIFRHKHVFDVREVTLTTNTLIRTGALEFRRSDGQERGCANYHSRRYIRPASEEDIAIVNRAKLIYKVSHAPEEAWAMLTDEQLAIVKEILDETAKKILLEEGKA